MSDANHTTTSPSPAPKGPREPQVLSHNYDGIQEYDNPTPGWWHIIFLATVLICGPYILIFHFNPGVPGPVQRMAATEQAYAAAQFKKVGKLSLDEDTVLTALGNPQWLSVGAGVFKANCMSCHGASGQGLVGPNLTDDFYKNCKTIMDIATVVQNGAAGQAMPAWRNRLTQNEVILVSAYVASLRGGNASGRAPEGERIAPWSSAKAPAAPAIPAAPAGTPKSAGAS